MRRAFLLLLLIFLLPRPASAQEIFSWWRRELVDLDLRPGGWVEFVNSELAEGELSTEHIRVTVLDEAPGGQHWIELSTLEESPQTWIFRIAPKEELRKGEALDGLLEAYRILPAGAVEKEDVTKLREQRLLRRQFQEIFVSPEIERRSLPDTTIDGLRLPREELHLSETRRDTVSMGRRQLVYRNVVDAVAQVSAQVPIFGLLSAKTTTILSSEGAGRDLPPPLITQSELRCIRFGRMAEIPGLPEALRALRESP